MERNELIKLLGEMMQQEYTDIFLYHREADIIKEKELSEQFKKFERMELRHADNLAIQIRILGGKPKWEFTILDTNKSLEKILLNHDPMKMIKMGCVPNYENSVGKI